MLFSAFNNNNDKKKHRAAAPPRPRATTMTRYYYSDDKLFEKSLDVYAPADGTRDGSMPAAVLLVVGSGWMGHHWSIYRATSWWNASGPKTIASCGTICICIRHRGAFFKVPPVVPAHLLTTVVIAQNRSSLLLSTLLLITATATAIAIAIGCSSSAVQLVED